MPKRLDRREREAFLKGRHVGVLGTVSPDGQPVLTPIWYLYREGRILMRTSEDSVKARNIRRDPRVSLCVQDERPPYRSVTLYGSAAIEPEEPGLAGAIAHHYLGAVASAAYRRISQQDIQQGPEVMLVLTPERALTQDFSQETPLSGRLWLRLKRLLPPWL
jgi:PPOX class probable F420-dependent enzyme